MYVEIKLDARICYDIVVKVIQIGIIIKNYLALRILLSLAKMYVYVLYWKRTGLTQKGKRDGEGAGK